MGHLAEYLQKEAQFGWLKNLLRRARPRQQYLPGMSPGVLGGLKESIKRNPKKYLFGTGYGGMLLANALIPEKQKAAPEQAARKEPSDIETSIDTIVTHPDYPEKDTGLYYGLGGGAAGALLGQALAGKGSRALGAVLGGAGGAGAGLLANFLLAKYLKTPETLVTSEVRKKDKSGSLVANRNIQAQIEQSEARALEEQQKKEEKAKK